MKNTKLLLFTLLLIFKVSLSNGQNQFQGFEGTTGDTWNYTVTPGTYNEAGGTDVWEVSTSVGSIATAATGSNFWGARDLENPGSGGTAEHTLDFDPVNLSNYNMPILSFKYHTDGYDGSDSLGYYIEYDNGNTWTNYTPLNKSTNVWTTETITIPNNSSHVRIRFAFTQNGGSDYAAFDDIVVYSNPNTFQGLEATANDNWGFMATPAAYNEAAATDIWEVSTSVGSITTAATGSNFWGARDLENPGSGGTAEHTLDFNSVYIDGLSNVTVSFKYHTDGYDGPDSLGYYIEYDNGNTWKNYTALNKSTNAWATVNVSVPANSQFVRLRLAVIQNGGSDYAGFDDFKVSTTPPPSAIAWDKDLVVGNEGDKLTVTVNVTGANASPASFDIELVSGFGTASASDINSFTKQTVNVPANTNGAYTVDIETTQDADNETDEYFAVKLTNPTNAVISGDEYVTLYIKDNDKKAPIAKKNISLNHVGSYLVGDPNNNNSAEIIAFDKSTNRLFVANSTGSKVEILDFTDPSNIKLIKSVDISTYGGINSIAVYNGVLALGIENANPVLAGSIVFMDTDGKELSQVTAGVLPDMVVFTPDGKKVLSANEGQPNTDYSVDPEGSITIVDISGGAASVTQANVTEATFTSFNAQEAALKALGVRVYGPGSTLAQDIEPEYITISDDSKTAWITCQENNAIVTLNIDNAIITSIKPLGTKDHSRVENAFDASDKGDDILLGNWPVKGMYQPDAVASYKIGTKTYLVTANEGDAREYDAIEEEERVKDLKLDSTKFPFAHLLQKEHNLGRLTAVTTIGDTDNDGDIDEIHILGGRSFSIWDAAAGTLVYDSKDDMERMIKDDPKWSAIFNASNSSPSLKNRSDNKGPEPEGVVLANINDTTYAFIGLERVGGIMTYNITDANNPMFVDYVNNRSLATDSGDLGPEGLIYIGENESSNGKRYLLVANEISATISVYEVRGYVAQKSTVGFSTSAVTIKEDAAEQIITINLNPKADFNGRVVLDVTNGVGAEYGATKDYTLNQNPVGDSLVFNVTKGDQTITTTMTVNKDTLTENDETVTFAIRSVSEKLVLGTINTLTVTIENVSTGPNSIDELDREKLNIYPNPTNNGIINLSLESSGIINDINGRQVIEFTNTKTINVTSLNKGVYILRTKSGVNARVVVQ
jgi:hypothetical protein